MTQQVIANTVTGTITKSGNASAVLASAIQNSTLTVAVTAGDDAATVAYKCRYALAMDVTTGTNFIVGGTGAIVQMTARAEADNDITMALTIDNGTCEGLTRTLSSITTPGVADEPVSVATAKSYLRVTGTSEDALIGMLVKAAREQGEQISRQAYITQTLTQVEDEWPEDYILPIRCTPLQSVTSIAYVDSDGVSYTWTDYRLDISRQPGSIIFDSLPSESLRESGAITVTYVAGYGASSTDVPNRIIQAILMLVAYWYENREAGNVPDDIRSMFLADRQVWF